MVFDLSFSFSPSLSLSLPSPVADYTSTARTA